MTAAIYSEADAEKRRLAFRKSFSLEHANSFKHRSLIDDAKFESASNAEFEKFEQRQFPMSPSFSKSPTLSISKDDCFQFDDVTWGNESEDDKQKTCNLLVRLNEGMDVLPKVLNTFESPSTLKHVESRKPKSNKDKFEVYIQFETTKSHLIILLNNLRDLSCLLDVTLLPDEEPGKEYWFPRHISELDECTHLVTKFEPELDTDHPGFCDKIYRERRKIIADIAFSYKQGQKIPRVVYAQDEIQTWGEVYKSLIELFPTHACKEHIEIFRILERECGYSPKNIPQLEDVSEFLRKRSGFQLRPVSGLLSARDFLASLAFRVFQCTQYVRHSSRPFHSPEPDCIHELLGHVPLLAYPSFAEFSQEIGLASLGASDEDIEKFATLYWFTVEFGLCKENGSVRAIGAGLLSSFGELKHALSSVPEIKPFQPFVTALQEYQDIDYQPIYFVAESFEDMKAKMRKYAKSIKRPHEVAYDPFTQSVEALSIKNMIEKKLQKLTNEIQILQATIDHI